MFSPTRRICASETLYSKTIMETQALTRLELPRMDVDEVTGKALGEASRTGYNLTVGGGESAGGKQPMSFHTLGSNGNKLGRQCEPMRAAPSHPREVRKRAGPLLSQLRDRKRKRAIPEGDLGGTPNTRSFVSACSSSSFLRAQYAAGVTCPRAMKRTARVSPSYLRDVPMGARGCAVPLTEMTATETGKRATR